MSNEATERGHDFVLQTLLAKAVFRLDRHLQNSGGVFCYTSDPKCIFRVSLTRLQSPAALDSFTTVFTGALIAELHLWNEQLPVLSEYESLIAWALTLSRGLAHSLRLLSAYMAERRDLDEVRAIRAGMALGTTDMTERLLSLSGRYGFRPCSEPHGEASLAHRFGENILMSMMMLARNATAFRLSALRRTRVLVFMTRDVLDQRFGAASNRPMRPV